MRILLVLLALIIIAALIVIAIMHFYPNINYREMPKGLIEGNLANSKPNWVSSHVAKTDPHYIAPLPAVDLAPLARCILERINNTTIAKLDKSQLIAYRRSPIFNFTDWLVIDSQGQVCSSATMGYDDFGKNRELIEQIRQRCVLPAH